MRLSSYSCFRAALQKSQVMTSFRPPVFFPGGATAGISSPVTVTGPATHTKNKAQPTQSPFFLRTFNHINQT